MPRESTAGTPQGSVRPRARSRELFARAQKLLVGGVNSPVRAFGSVGGEPIVVERAAGARLWDADGNEYLDYVCSWGALILGHADPDVIRAVAEQAARGTSYGMTTSAEAELAARIVAALPSIEKVRLVSSGTEATMSAVRLARAATSRDLVLKFEGCYHGHGDSFLSQAGSGFATLGIASSPGVPQALAALTLNAPYNDLEAVERIFGEHRASIAAVIVEPVAANMGVVPPAAGFLRGLREITERNGALLIFDEVISGFRLCYGGAQTLYGITPDLTTLGKIVGGGLPLAAYGGRRDLMQRLAPEGPVYQAGTLSGNPVAVRAGLVTLEKLSAPGFYDALNRKAARLADGISSAIADAGVVAQVVRVGSLLTIFFGASAMRNYADVKRCDTVKFGAFFRALLERGILLPPSQFEALFVSAAHSDDDIAQTIATMKDALLAA